MNQENNNQINNNEQQVNETQPEVGYEYVEQEVPKEGIAKSSIVIIVILILIIAFEAWYIYDYKFKDSKTEEVPTQAKLITFDNSQVTKRENVSEDGKQYYQIITIKNSNLTVDLKFFTQKSGEETEEGYDDKIMMHLYINGVKKGENVLEEYFRCYTIDCETVGSYIFDDVKESVENYILRSIGTIRGDKNYLYLQIARENSSIYVINENGEIIDTNGIKFYGDYHDQGNFLLTDSCKTYKYGKKDEDIKDKNFRVGDSFIQEDAIYYLALSKNVEEKDYANEYKVIFRNDKMNKEKIGNCEVEPVGEKIADEDYEDM